MVIRSRRDLFEDMVARLQQQQRTEEGGSLSGDDLPAVRLEAPEGPDGDSVTVRFGGDGVDVTLTRGNVVLHGDDEALVVGPDGHHLFKFDPSGNVVGSLFVANDGEEGIVDEAARRQDLLAVESARIYWDEALAHLDRFEVKKLFDV